MIGICDVEIQAANPSMPLYPLRAFINSPSSLRIRNVPKKIGTWIITSVQLVAAYPDGSIKTANCVLVGGIWVGTIEGCPISGRSENGFTVFASGIDENGNPVSNYVLGKGLIEILQADGTITPDAPSYYVHLYDAQPTTPKEGDMYPTSNGYAIWQNNTEHQLGLTRSDVVSIVTERTQPTFGNWIITPEIQEYWDIEYGINNVWRLMISPDEHEPPIITLYAIGEEDATTLVFNGSSAGINDFTATRSLTPSRNVLNLAMYQDLDIYATKSEVDAVDALIPAQASASNQLADKAFVNSSVQTATANFRGNWATWNDVPDQSEYYPVDYAGSRTPTVNDYMVVQDASGYAGSQTLAGTWRFKYSGQWSVDNLGGWLPEYQVNETPMTAAQLAAINSNITAAKVAYYDSSLSGLEDLIDSI